MKKKSLLLILVVLVQFSVFSQVTKIYDLSASSGKEPLGGLITDGTFLYGMTQWGGSNNKGVVFKIKPDGTNYTILYSFDNTNGEEPHGSLILLNDFLYGTTIKGGTKNNGVIFKIKTDGTNFNKIFSFDDASVAEIITDGTSLYGVSSSGDNNSTNGGQVGFVFKITTEGTGFSIIHQFQGTEGSVPQGKLLLINQYLYGVTSYGPTGSNGGIIYKVKTDGTGFSSVYSPEQGALNSIITDGVYFYCTTDFGGNPSGDGSIIKVKLDGTSFSMLKDFDYDNGSEPSGNLFIQNSELYGMTNSGGNNGYGVLYKINTDGTGYTILYHCVAMSNGNKGTNPRGGYVAINNNLYGMFQLGGINYVGSIFKYQLTTTSVKEVNSNLKVSVFPNPASDYITIQSDYVFVKYSVINNLGQIILTGQDLYDNKINVSSLKSGDYVFIFSTKDNKKSSVNIAVK